MRTFAVMRCTRTFDGNVDPGRLHTLGKEEMSEKRFQLPFEVSFEQVLKPTCSNKSR